MTRARRRSPRATPRKTARSKTPKPARSRTHEAIYAAVRRIPRGKVATYGDVAHLAGMPNQPRLVGYALHATPSGMDLPWHRVVNAQGRISTGRGVAGGELPQRFRLEAEGIVFDQTGRLSLDRYRWKRAPRRRPSQKRTKRPGPPVRRPAK